MKYYPVCEPNPVLFKQVLVIAHSKSEKLLLRKDM